MSVASLAWLIGKTVTLVVEHPNRWKSDVRQCPHVGEVGKVMEIREVSRYTKKTVLVVDFENAGNWEKLPWEISSKQQTSDECMK
jgi:hypothetical protein